MSIYEIAEVRALRDADALGDHELVDQLLEEANIARYGYSDPEGLRVLAALSLTLARRIEAAITRQQQSAGDDLIAS